MNRVTEGASLTFLLACLGGVCLAGARQERNYRGEAYDLKTGEFLYSEVHTEVHEGGAHVASEVSYRDARDREIVRKEIDFRRSRTAPDFRSADKRTGYTEGAETTAAGSTRLFWRKDSSHNERSKTLRIPRPAVIDAGFDYFIRENWDALAQGKPLTFHFAVPHHLDYAHFRVAEIGEVTLEGVRCLHFRLAPTAFLAGFFVDPIYVAYDIDTRRLVDYRGVTNIADDKGKSHRAWITFAYPQTPRAGAAPPNAAR